MNSLTPTRFAVVLLCLCAAMFGCNTKQKQRQSIDALHKELRWQEDQIYQLQDAIEQYQDALSKCRTGQRGSSSASNDSPRRDFSDGNGSSIAPELPKVELGDPDENSGDLPPIDSVPTPLDPPATIPMNTEPRPIDMGTSDVKQIRLHAILTGGVDRDGQPGDEGIQVVIEPLDAQGKVLPAMGDVAIALMDHTLPEGSQRLAFWTFDADNAEKQIRHGGISDGLQFELMWGSDRHPTHRELDVYVRFTTADGRQLDTRGRVRIRLPEDVARWKKPAKLTGAEDHRPKSIRPVSGTETIAPRYDHTLEQ